MNDLGDAMRFIAYLLIALLVGCGWRGPGLTPPSRSLLFSAVTNTSSASIGDQECSLAVVINRPRSYQTQGIPSSWDRAEVSLSNPTLLSAPQTRFIDQAGGSGIAAAFTGLRPGSGYSLTVTLKSAGVIRAQGSNGAFTLAVGNNSIALGMGINFMASTFAGSRTPAAGTTAANWGMSIVGILATASGSLYIADPSNHVILKQDTSGILSTVAGNGLQGFSGDGGAATSAKLNTPYGMALDSSGNFYFADSCNHRIRKIDSNGSISTVAGNGTQGYQGDGGLALDAVLNAPFGLALDSSGNLYFTDSGNNRIRKIDTHGVITTVAGNGTAGYSGDGAAATNAMLNSPNGLALDSSGNLYFADSANSRIRKVGTDGLVSTIAGTGNWGFSGDGLAATSAILNGPYSVTVDSSGNLYCVDTYNHRVRKIDTSGVISTVAGTGTPGFFGDGGPGVNAMLNNPYGLTVDGSGNVYVADSANHRVRKIAANGDISTVAGNGTQSFAGDGGSADSAMLCSPYGVALDSSGNLYISDTFNHRIRKVATDGSITTVAGNGSQGYSGDSGAATSAMLNYPYGLAVDGSGNLYFTDSSNHRIRKVATDGTITTVAGNGSQGYSGDSGAATGAMLNYPYGLALDSSGNLYVADALNHRIRKVATNGTISTVAGNGSQGYSGDNSAASGAMLNTPNGVTVDSTGNLYIADTGNHRIRKVGTDATITTVAGNGSQGYSGDSGAATGAMLNAPNGLAVDSLGTLYVIDKGNQRIRKLATDGILTTIIGNGSQGFSGDGSLADTALVSNPNGLAVNSSGHLYVADTGNHRIRKLH